MKKLKVLALALVCAVFSPAKADEGMWLLQLMQEQNLADRMKAQGLKMDIMDIYNPDQITLKDAVGIFGRGCTGEIISPNGLILTLINRLGICWVINSRFPTNDENL